MRQLTLALLLLSAATLALGAGGTKKRVIVLCTGNSARSQMSEGFLKSFDSRLEVHCTDAEKLAVFRRVRDDIRRRMKEYFDSEIRKSF